MIWASWGDFFAMGGYAFYIWGSLIVVAICMFGEVVGLKLRRKALSQRRPMSKGMRKTS